MHTTLFSVTTATSLLVSGPLTGAQPTHSDLEYKMVNSYFGDTFFSGWEFQNIPDPTNGFVTYVDYDTARIENLTGYIRDPSTQQTTAYIGVDHKRKVTTSRNSVRITTSASWSNGGLFIADVKHSPLGICGTWPALWLVGPSWPNGGEIDIIEGVNDAQYNTMTLHTSDNSLVSNASRTFAGTMISDTCTVDAASGNTGCGVTAPESIPYNSGTHAHSTAGHAFNAQGGGIYATLWTEHGISIYLFPRHAIPTDILAGKPNPHSWTEKPLARFSGNGCSYFEHFSQLQMVINTDFCGDWAGDVWDGSSCQAKTGAATCEDFVANDPVALKHAYWEIKKVEVYQLGGGN